MSQTSVTQCGNDTQVRSPAKGREEARCPWPSDIEMETFTNFEFCKLSYEVFPNSELSQEQVVRLFSQMCIVMCSMAP